MMALPPTGRKLPPLLPQDDGEDSPRRGRKKKRAPGNESPERPLGTGTARERRRQRSESRERVPSADRLGSTGGEPSPKPKTPGRRAPPPKRSATETPSGGRRKKTPSKLTIENSQPSVNGSNDQLDSPSNESRPKKRRKKKKPVSESRDNLTDNLADEEDLNQILGMDVTNIMNDIIDVKTLNDTTQVESENEEQIPPMPTHTLGPVMKSQASDRLYIEQRKGFKSQNKTVLARRLAENEREKWAIEQQEPTTTSLELSLATHKGFKIFATFCHGLLAGLSLAQAILVFVLTSFGDSDFISHYRPLALPYESVFYFLCVVCTVSVFDRYDIAYPNKRFLLRCVTVQSGAIVVLIYAVCLVVCNSIEVWDDRLGDHYNATYDTNLWNNTATTQAILGPWKAMNTVRAAGAILGWFIVSLRPGTDRLAKNLQQSDENFIGDDVPGVHELVAKVHPPGVYKTKSTIKDPYAHVAV